MIQREQVAPVLRRIDFSTAAITFALFLTLVTAQVVTIAEGENGPTTLKTIYGAFPLPSTLTQTQNPNPSPTPNPSLNSNPSPSSEPYPYSYPISLPLPDP